jgi:bacterioferritin
MKGNERVIVCLNALLADELTAINQYMVHSEMCANWGYQRLHEAVEKRAIQEMKHAEKLIGRILFLEGIPTVTRLNEIHIGSEVESQLKNDWPAEHGAIGLYNKAVALCIELGDSGSRDLVAANRRDEESHIDWIEAQFDQIKQLGIQNYLAAQVPVDAKK